MASVINTPQRYARAAKKKRPPINDQIFLVTGVQMSQQPPMSTPIQALPQNPSNNVTVPSSTPEQDAIINGVLKDCSLEMKNTMVQSEPFIESFQPQVDPSSYHMGNMGNMNMGNMGMNMGMGNMNMGMGNMGNMNMSGGQVRPPWEGQQTHNANKGLKQYWNIGLAQQAAIAAVIAFVVFYPDVTNIIYRQVPALFRLQKYDLFVRLAILALIYYGALLFNHKK